jgi:hypothetical protein
VRTIEEHARLYGWDEVADGLERERRRRLWWRRLLYWPRRLFEALQRHEQPQIPGY